MALSKYSYVRSFEELDKLAPLQWIVINLKLTNEEKLLPISELLSKNDNLNRSFNHATAIVMKEFKDIKLSYGYNNSYSIVFGKDTDTYVRRASKLVSNVVSLFTSHVTFRWNSYFPLIPLHCNISVESNVMLFPNDQCLRDFLTLRQYKCHLYNLKKVCILYLVNNGSLIDEAKDFVSKLSVGEKNELLFSKFNVNYNNESIFNKKGTILLPKKVNTNQSFDDDSCYRINKQLIALAKDMHKDEFWKSYLPLVENTTHIPVSFYEPVFTKTRPILPHSWVVVRIDGKCFHKFVEKHSFSKPNDKRCLKLFGAAAKQVMLEFPSFVLGYGQSDEFSFVMKRYNHGESCKYNLITRVVSQFTCSFVNNWSTYFPDMPLQHLPSFDGRVVIYPNSATLRDYLSWRQVDCHINNMYNTCFWNLIQKQNLTPMEAGNLLTGTFSQDKINILKYQLDIDYHKEDSLFRKGTVLYETEDKSTNKRDIVEDNCDIILDGFWMARSWILGSELRIGDMSK